MSPTVAKLALTPPVVGWVSTERYGSRACACRASAPQVFAICMSESIPSYMRAPPEAETMITGSPRRRRALHRARELFPHHRAHGRRDEVEIHHRQRHAVPPELPWPVITASFSPVLRW